MRGETSEGQERRASGAEVLALGELEPMIEITGWEKARSNGLKSGVQRCSVNSPTAGCARRAKSS